MQNQIPKNWQKEELRNVLSLLKDGSHNPPKRTQTGIRFLAGATDIKYRNIDFSKCTFISIDDYKKIHKYYEIKATDVLLTIVGTIGNTAIVREEDLPFSLQRSIAILRGKDRLLDNRYLFYWVSSSHFQAALKANTNPTGQPGIYLGTIGGFEINIPPINEQIKIASILSDLDDKINMNNKIAKNLEEVAQTIFKEWFIKDKNKLHPKQIKDLGRVVTGKTPSTKDLLNFGSDFPFVTIPDMVNTFVLKTERYLSQKSADKMKKMFLPVGSVCVSCIATVGLVSITTEESISNQQINSIIPNEEYYTYFLYQFFKTNKELLQAYGAAGSTTLIVNKTQFESMDIHVPDDLIMKKFHRLVEPVYKKLLAISKENQKLVALRDLILPKLMKGEIRV